MPEVPARPYIGGQAVLEGVMMRSPGSMSIVCRRRSGELIVRERPVVEKTGSLRKLPFLRGIVTVVESLKMGSQAMRWSAKLYEEDLMAEEEGETHTPAPKGPSMLSMLALSMVALGTLEGEPPPFVAEEKRNPLLTAIPIVFAIGLFGHGGAAWPMHVGPIVAGVVGVFDIRRFAIGGGGCGFLAVGFGRISLVEFQNRVLAEFLVDPLLQRHERQLQDFHRLNHPRSHAETHVHPHLLRGIKPHLCKSHRKEGIRSP